MYSAALPTFASCIQVLIPIHFKQLIPMKNNLKIGALLFFLTIACSVSAQTSTTLERNGSGLCKTFLPVQKVEELVIAGELKIVLTDDSLQMIRIEGEKAAVNSIRVKTDGVRLKITTAFFSLTMKKPRILISLNRLKRLKVVTDATVVSDGVLHLDDFQVLMDTNGKVALDLDGNCVFTCQRGYGSVDIHGPYTRMISKRVAGWYVNKYESANGNTRIVETADTSCLIRPFRGTATPDRSPSPSSAHPR